MSTGLAVLSASAVGASSPQTACAEGPPGGPGTTRPHPRWNRPPADPRAGRPAWAQDDPGIRPPDPPEDSDLGRRRWRIDADGVDLGRPPADVRSGEAPDRGRPTTTQKQGFGDAAMLTIGLVHLSEALGHLAGTPPAVIAGEFDRLEELVSALPLTNDEYCLAANRIAGAREYWSASDRGAARNQLRMIGRKLTP